MTTVTGTEIIQSHQIFLLTIKVVVIAPVLDIGSGDVVVVKNWVPKIELTVEMGRNTIANIESVFMTWLSCLIPGCHAWFQY